MHISICLVIHTLYIYVLQINLYIKQLIYPKITQYKLNRYSIILYTCRCPRISDFNEYSPLNRGTKPYYYDIM